MIYVSTTYAIIAKKSLKEKCFQASLDKIKELLPKDPEISGMDALIIAPKDINSISGNSVIDAIKEKHEKVIVFYLYQKEREDELIPDGNRIIKFKAGKLSPQDIERLVQEFMETDVSSKKLSQLSNDRIKPVETLSDNQGLEEIVENETMEVTEVMEVMEQVSAASEPVVVDRFMKHKEDEKVAPLEERIRKFAEFADWNFFKEALKHDTVIGELMNENTQFAAALNMLDIMDRHIENTFKDSSILPEEKFRQIKEIGLDRSGYKATANNILTDKIINVINAVISSASMTVNKQVKDIKASLGNMEHKNVAFKDTEKLNTLINKRLELQTQLLELSRQIIEVYKTIDVSVNDTIKSFDEALPSENNYINELMKPMKEEFTPQNAVLLAGRLMSGLQFGHTRMSALESKVKFVISLVFKLCETDGTIIDYQNKLIQLLSAQRVEDVVIVDTILKNALRLYIGPSEVGRTATCLTWCSILSRRQNCLLIDLTGSSKFNRYGVEAISLDKFLGERIEEQFVCVEGTLNSTYDVAKFVGELKLRLNYYPYVNIILDVSQSELIKELSQSALTVHFISSCTPRSIELTRNCINNFTSENVARKIVLIDPPISATDILHSLKVDPLIYKVVIIPYLLKLKACSLCGINPSSTKEISTVYEEAFK
jgi:hypothetical protein